MRKTDQLWAEVLAESKNRLSRSKAFRSSTLQSAQDVSSSLVEAQRIFGLHWSAKYVAKLEPLFQRLDAFSRAISSAVQADPGYASLVWGSVLVVLQCASQFFQVLDRITDMLETMTLAMPRFEKYMDLYPTSVELQGVLRKIYKDHLDFCIDSITFLGNKPFYQMIKLLWSRFSSKFNSTVEQIRKHSRDFESEARLAHDIAAAEHRQIVENALPQISRIPQIPDGIFSVPYHRNPRFHGRLEALKALDDSLRGSSVAQKSCAVHGIGGLGKTQTALEFCYAAKEQFSYIFWLRAQDEPSLADAFAAIAHHLHLVPQGFTDQLGCIGLARQWLCDNLNWLLIFDNVNSSHVLSRFWPPCRHGALVFTTQATDLSYRATSDIDIQSFGLKEGAMLLMEHVHSANMRNDPSALQAAEALSAEVGGLPLLLVGLAGYISESHISPAEVLSIFRKSRLQAAQVLTSHTTTFTTFQYDRSIQMVFSIALNELPSSARNVLNIMAMLSPDHIPEDILNTDIQVPELSFLSFNDSIRFIEDVRLKLKSRHLITVATSEPEVIFSVHRSVQLAILTDLDRDPEQRQHVFDQAVAILRRVLPRPSIYMVPLFGRWTLFEKYIPHVLNLQHVFERSSSRIAPTPQFAELLCHAGAYLYERGLGNNGLDILATAEQACTKLSPFTKDNSKSTWKDKPLELPDFMLLSAPSLASLEADIWSYIAGIHGSLGGLVARQETAKATMKQLGLRKQHLNQIHQHEQTVSDHILLANAYNDVGCVYLDNEDYHLAEDQLLKSLEIKAANSHGATIPQFEDAESKKNLAIVKLAAGSNEEALTLIAGATSLLEIEEGPDSGSSLLFRFVWAMTLWQSGYHVKAQEMHEMVLKNRLKTLGETNFMTLHSFFAVAQCHHNAGRYQAARENFEKCRANHQTAHWPRECTIRLDWELSRTLAALGDESALESGNTAVEERNALLALYAPEVYRLTHRQDTEAIVLFDHLVNVEAGRTSIGRLQFLLAEPEASQTTAGAS